MATLRGRVMMVAVAASLLGGLLAPVGCSLKAKTSPDPAPGPGGAPSAGAASNATTEAPEVEAGVRIIDGDELIDLASADAMIVDVRAEEDFELEHLPDAVSVPSEDLTDKSAKWDKEDAVVLYGSKDAKAQTCAAGLVRNGFERVYRLSGGIEAWDGDREGLLGKYRLDKPTVTYIYSTTDTVCIEMTPEVRKLAEKYKKRAAFNIIDTTTLIAAILDSAGKEPTEEQKRVAEEVGTVWIDSVPTFIFAEPDPRVYRKIEGADGLRVLYAWLKDK